MRLHSWLRSILVLGGLALFAVAVPAFADSVTIPALTGPVIDEAGLLSRATEQRLSEAFRHLQSRGGAQIQIFTFDTLGDDTIEQVGIRAADAWKLGNLGRDDGLIVLVAKKERQTRIEVSHGLEGVIPDAVAKQIVSEVMIPLFRSGDFDSGILLAAHMLSKRTNPDIDLSSFFEGVSVAKSRTRERGIPPIFILLALIFIPFFFGGRRRHRGFFGGGGFGGGLGGGGFGGGGFGGGGGGGWSGGGGSFGGGGASGNW